MRRSLLAFLVVALIYPPWAWGQILPGPGVQLQDEGTDLGRARTLNCVGAGIACTQSGGTGTLTVGGGAGGTPAGVSTSVQYNSTGAFGGDTALRWDVAASLLTVNGQINAGAGPKYLAASHNGTNGVLGVIGGGNLSLSAVLLSDVLAGAGSECLHVNTAGVISSAGADCGVAGVTRLNFLTGAVTLLGTTNQVTVASSAGSNITLSLPQSIANTSNVTFASVISTNAAAGSTFASCVQVNTSGVLYNTGASCTTVNTLAGALSITAGSNITVTTTAPGTIQIAATGGSGTVTTTGTPASGNLAKFSGATSITNGDISGDATTSGTLALTLANSGITAGTYGGLTFDAKGRATAGSGSEFWIAMASSVTVTNSASLTSTNLALALGSSATEAWGFECNLIASATGSSAQSFAFKWTGPTGFHMGWAPYFNSATIDWWGVAAAGGPVNLNNEAATLVRGTAAAALALQGLHFRGFIFGGGTPGQVLLAFAQSAATASNQVTLGIGSHCLFRKLIA